MYLILALLPSGMYSRITVLRISKIRALWREELNRALYWAVVGVFVLQTALAIVGFMCTIVAERALTKNQPVVCGRSARRRATLWQEGSDWLFHNIP